MSRSHPIQGSLFEEDYLVRTVGTIAQDPDVALTELVANAWDAGATLVQIKLPTEDSPTLTIEDDGCGMTPEQFHQKWMTLAYNRLKHEGRWAEFPPQRASAKRPAFGRNGVGRHGLLCFASRYKVETKRDGSGGIFVIATSSGQHPLILTDERTYKAKGHGTKLSTKVTRNLPSAERILEILAARYLHDPQFTVQVNGRTVALTELSGFLNRSMLQVNPDLAIEAFFVDSTKAARTTRHQGIAFWVGGRLVGVPSWILGYHATVDGRTRVAKRYTVVITSSALFDEVLPDWSGFRRSSTMDTVYEVVGHYVDTMFRTVAAERVQDATEGVFRTHRVELSQLRPSEKREVAEFVANVTAEQPMVPQDTLSVAVQAMIRMEKTRSGAALLEKLSQFSPEDVAGLDRILSEWSVRDALTVLDEIDRRLVIVEAIQRLSNQSGTDELHTLHPLITQSRWLFGPEFDSPEYASNVSLTTAAYTVFKKRATAGSFLNERKRPDLVILADATLSSVATEQIDESSGLATIKDVLLIELKKGDSTIGREEANQATGYVEDLLACGLLDGNPSIRAFVVGYRADNKTQPIRTVQNSAGADVGKIQITTYGQLVRTAHKRLFRLREHLSARYGEIDGSELMDRVLREPEQFQLVPHQ